MLQELGACMYVCVYLLSVYLEESSIKVQNGNLVKNYWTRGLYFK